MDLDKWNDNRQDMQKKQQQQLGPPRFIFKRARGSFAYHF